MKKVLKSKEESLSTFPKGADYSRNGLDFSQGWNLWRGVMDKGAIYYVHTKSADLGHILHTRQSIPFGITVIEAATELYKLPI